MDDLLEEWHKKPAFGGGLEMLKNRWIGQVLKEGIMLQDDQVSSKRKYQERWIVDKACCEDYSSLYHKTCWKN